MRALAIVAVFVSLIILGGSCTDDIVEPRPTGADTTSHDFTWEYTIIDADNSSGGILTDICYINDTCIWAVGWIVREGPQGERLLYNACRWDGQQWNLEQVFDSIPGDTRQQVHRLYAVYGAEPDNIWFAKATVLIHWDGQSFRTDRSVTEQMKGFIGECWASGPNNIYMGGTDGELVHYNGQYWKRIESEMKWDIGGMHGNGDTLLVASTGPTTTGETAFYTVVGESVRFFKQDSLPHGVQAVWYNHLNDIHTDGVHTYHWDGLRWNKMIAPLPAGFGLDMAANSANDLFVCGEVCSIRHFNGNSWRSWYKLPGIETARLWAVTVQQHDVWIVGNVATGSDAVIVHGRRNP
jgi:hypothetical protein